ncbi:hypothetical protein GFM29_09270 [Rhizobium leguminosarum bv. viciae]|nr:hypothetical protein [Rhizobium leguminosarum bv. viciae]
MWHRSGIRRSSLIPVLVTGIQPRRVRAVVNPYSVKRSSTPKDLGVLDPCDKHRDEGASGGHQSHSITS